LGSPPHLVEIDLLRGGEPMPVSGGNIQGSYRILVSRSALRPRADLYIFNLQDLILPSHCLCEARRKSRLSICTLVSIKSMTELA
jgi:hypothetical protein